MVRRLSLVMLVGLGGCSDYGVGDPVDPVDPVDPPPFACSRAFAESFGGELVVTEGPARQVTFAGDCRRMLVVDDAVQLLIVADLETREVRRIAEGVDLAYFVPESDLVLFYRPAAVYRDLFLADDQAVHPIDTGVTSLLPGPRGRSFVYLKDPDPETYAGELWLASLDVLPPEKRLVSASAVGAMAYTPDGERLVFLTDPVKRSHESPNITCEWHTTTLRSTSVRGDESSVLAGDVLAWNFRLSGAGDRVYVGRDYDCEAQTRELVSVPLSAGETIRLVRGQPACCGAEMVVELPDRGRILHPMLFTNQDWTEVSSELWTTSMDGSDSDVLVDDVMSTMQISMYFVPFQRVSDRHVVYVRREVHDIAAVDLDSGDSWIISEGVHGLFFAASPDGSQVLTQIPEQAPEEVRITPVTGSGGRVLLDGPGPGGRIAWSPSGERILALTGTNADSPRVLLAIDPENDASYVIADDVPFHTIWGNDFASHPGGFLVAVQREAGLVILPVP